MELFILFSFFFKKTYSFGFVVFLANYCFALNLMKNYFSLVYVCVESFNVNGFGEFNWIWEFHDGSFKFVFKTEKSVWFIHVTI